MAFEFDKKFTIGNALTMLTVMVFVITGFVYLETDVKKVKEQQEIHNQFRSDVRENFVNREQLDYMVIQRLDRMERNIDTKLDRIEDALEVNNQ